MRRFRVMDLPLSGHAGAATRAGVRSRACGIADGEHGAPHDVCGSPEEDYPTKRPISDQGFPVRSSTDEPGCAICVRPPARTFTGTAGRPSTEKYPPPSVTAFALHHQTPS